MVDFPTPPLEFTMAIIIIPTHIRVLPGWQAIHPGSHPAGKLASWHVSSLPCWPDNQPAGQYVGQPAGKQASLSSGRQDGRLSCQPSCLQASRPDRLPDGQTGGKRRPISNPAAVSGVRLLSFERSCRKNCGSPEKPWSDGHLPPRGHRYVTLRRRAFSATAAPMLGIGKTSAIHIH